MSSLEIRPTHVSDLSSLQRVWEVVYHRGEPYGPEDAPDLAAEEWGAEAWIENDLAGGFWCANLNLSWGEAIVPTIGIAGVGVMPHRRGQKVADALMRWSLEEAARRNVPLASLYAYRESYYRRFGYEIAGQRWRIKCPQNRFPVTKATLPVRQLRATDTQELAACYDQFAQRLTGAHHRTIEDWGKRLGKRTPMIFVVGDPVQAYCWTHMDGNFWEELSLGELAWSTREGYESILAVIRGLAENRNTVTWEEPANSPFVARFLDQGIEVARNRTAMFRIVCMQDFVPLCRTTVSPASVTVQISDSVLAENQGNWLIVGDENGLTVSKTDRGADIEMSIGQFSQGALGDPSFRSMASSGMIPDCEAVNALDQLFPPRTVFLTEFF